MTIYFIPPRVFSLPMIGEQHSSDHPSQYVSQWIRLAMCKDSAKRSPAFDSASSV